jgi:hypothetical protein
VVEDRHRNGAGLISQFSMLSNGPKLQYHLHDLCLRCDRSLTERKCLYVVDEFSLINKYFDWDQGIGDDCALISSASHFLSTLGKLSAKVK